MSDERRSRRRDSRSVESKRHRDFSPRKHEHREERSTFSRSGGAFPPNIDGMTSLKVDNITHKTGVNLLKRMFSKYGDVGDVYIPRSGSDSFSRGFAFVRFLRRREAEEAMSRMNGYVLDGRELNIQMARYARPSSSSSSRRSESSKTYKKYPAYSRSRSRSKSRDRREQRRIRHSNGKSRSRRSRSRSGRSRSRSSSRNRSERHSCDNRSNSRRKKD